MTAVVIPFACRKSGGRIPTPTRTKLAQQFVQGDYDEARAALEVMYQMGIVEGERRAAARLAMSR